MAVISQIIGGNIKIYAFTLAAVATHLHVVDIMFSDKNLRQIKKEQEKDKYARYF